MTRARGYTLFELLVALVMLALGGGFYLVVRLVLVAIRCLERAP